MKKDLVVWDRCDRAAGRMHESMVEFAVECKTLNDSGVTQAAIGERYGLNQASVSRFVRIGGDTRIIRNTNNLPQSSHSLYLLTTLTDEQFAAAAKPDVTQHELLKLRAEASQTKQELEAATEAALVAKKREDDWKAQAMAERDKRRELEAKPAEVVYVDDAKAVTKELRAKVKTVEQERDAAQLACKLAASKAVTKAEADTESRLKTLQNKVVEVEWKLGKIRAVLSEAEAIEQCESEHLFAAKRIGELMFDIGVATRMLDAHDSDAGLTETATAGWDGVVGQLRDATVSVKERLAAALKRAKK